MKTSACASDVVWKDIFDNIGDSYSSSVMQEAASDCESHARMLRETVTNVGVMEAHGDMFEED